MGMRHKGRELALQALYQLDMTGDASEKALGDLCDSFESSPSTRRFARQLVSGVCERRTELDELIAAATENWRLERLSRIDAVVMRLAIHEMTAAPALPVEIAINEAVELARKFGGTESARFVNGILDEVAGRLGLKRKDTAQTEPEADEDDPTAELRRR
jgi:N utilization substance protein B